MYPRKEVKSMNNALPVVKFDESIAARIFPRPELKMAAFMPIPRLEGGVELPTFIRAEWGEVQQFLGDYYVVIKDGKVIYGSAQLQWELMHVQIAPGRWVKVGIPTAYQATESCRVTTMILLEDGALRETSVELQSGDWIVRQPGGEVQHIKAAKKPQIYFTAEEAADLGLDAMTQLEFSNWALTQVAAATI